MSGRRLNQSIDSYRVEQLTAEFQRIDTLTAKIAKQSFGNQNTPRKFALTGNTLFCRSTKRCLEKHVQAVRGHGYVRHYRLCTSGDLCNQQTRERCLAVEATP